MSCFSWVDKDEFLEGKNVKTKILQKPKNTEETLTMGQNVSENEKTNGL